MRVILADAGGTPHARTLWLLASPRVVEARDVAEYGLGVVCWIEYGIPQIAGAVVEQSGSSSGP